MKWTPAAADLFVREQVAGAARDLPQRRHLGTDWIEHPHRCPVEQIRGASENDAERRPRRFTKLGVVHAQVVAPWTSDRIERRQLLADAVLGAVDDAPAGKAWDALERAQEPGRRLGSDRRWTGARRGVPLLAEHSHEQRDPGDQDDRDDCDRRLMAHALGLRSARSLSTRDDRYRVMQA